MYVFGSFRQPADSPAALTPDFKVFRVTQASEQDVNVLKMWVMGHIHVLDVCSACMEMLKTASRKDSSPVQNPTFEPL